MCGGGAPWGGCPGGVCPGGEDMGHGACAAVEVTEFVWARLEKARGGGRRRGAEAAARGGGALICHDGCHGPNRPRRKACTRVQSRARVALAPCKRHVFGARSRQRRSMARPPRLARSPRRRLRRLRLGGGVHGGLRRARGYGGHARWVDRLYAYALEAFCRSFAAAAASKLPPQPPSRASLTPVGRRSAARGVRLAPLAAGSSRPGVDYRSQRRGGVGTYPCSCRREWRVPARDP